MTDWIKRFYDGLQAYILKKQESPWWPVYKRTLELLKKPRPADEQVLEQIIDGLSPEDRWLVEELFEKGLTTEELAKKEGIQRKHIYGVHLRNIREKVCACIGYYTELGMFVMPSKHIVEDLHKTLKEHGIRKDMSESLFDKCFFSKLTLQGRHSCRALKEAYCEETQHCKFYRPLTYKAQSKEGYAQIKSDRTRKGLRL